MTRSLKGTSLTGSRRLTILFPGYTPSSLITKFSCWDVETVYGPRIALIEQTLSYSLYQDGYRHIQNIDFSESVIEKMSAKYSGLTQMTWEVRHLLSAGIYASVHST